MYIFEPFAYLIFVTCTKAENGAGVSIMTNITYGRLQIYTLLEVLEPILTLFFAPFEPSAAIHVGAHPRPLDVLTPFYCFVAKLVISYCLSRLFAPCTNGQVTLDLDLNLHLYR